jgi:CO/xanthine dehydrogenase FAD-binding subunit
VKGAAQAHELLQPASLDEALGLLAASPGRYLPIAGGTDLMVLFAIGRLAKKELLDLWRLDELRGTVVEDRTITFGALTTYSEVQAHPTVRADLPMLVAAGAETGGWAIQNRGTLGGNIANASPAADSPPALLAYGAELELVSTGGRRWVDYATFHTGYKKMLLRPDELIARIRVGRPPAGHVAFYKKVGPRRAQAISKVCFAGLVANGECRIALGGVAPIVTRAPKAEAAVRGGATAEDVASALMGDIAPIDDVRSNARYRRRVAGNLAAELVRRIQP